MQKICDFSATLVNLVNNSIHSSDFIDKYKFSDTDFTRKSPLNFPTLFMFLMNSLRSSNQDELDKFFKQVNGWDLPRCHITDSAFSQARKKLKYEAFIDISTRICQYFYEQYSWKNWLGFRLLAIDGSALKIKGDEYSKLYFGLVDNGSETPYALARISQCYDVLNHITLAANITPHSLGERELALDHLKSIHNHNDLIILDRGYPGVCFFRQILNSGRQFCARATLGSWTTVIKPFLESGLKEQIIDYSLRNDSKAECKRLGLSSESMKLRFIRIELKSGETEVLITSLLDTQLHPYELFSELYHLRWPVEEAYKVLKCRIQIENFTGKSSLAVKQDFFAKILMFNLTSMMIAPIDELAQSKSTKTKLDYKVNRTEAFRKMKEFGILVFFRKSVRKIIDRLQQFFLRKLIPIRLNRSFPRKNVKKKSKFAFAYKPLS